MLREILPEQDFFLKWSILWGILHQSFWPGPFRATDDWDGLTDYEVKRANMLAELGFVRFYGGLKTPQRQNYTKTWGKILIMQGYGRYNALPV